ncbi:3-oxoacyl-[acyl-carrier-protein] synthase III C-terminal domain-containing protein [Mycolicibacterium rhodesiae]|uniref:3-oxoacyl-ACP synthase n=1 Tax=Mycolicibacterium rhodesiae TaxID=36814 RepID=A0A1X0J7A3_MYCRH|nr:3-oxoacyl-[acyl-carrier-protein] synthase III C-terminal domain-containing protein [Mycolicibacterium rhodesiae]MCV7348298.1 3-oxoacyl-ACP synthase [Mycolicibacterium rhodesiae]ORB57367.1 3-oxoacyl-ACP synthase [Mycolicibacterium rhodesiae]
MGTVVEQVAVGRSRWRHRHSALHLAVNTAQDCLRMAGREPHDVDLLINAGIYRDRNLGEPALAALIQEDVGANPEDPHTGTHGTFSFDVANGACGVLTALQIVDGFLTSKTIDCAMVVASDADPGHGMSEHFPFSPTGAALLCTRTDDTAGIQQVHWASIPDGGDSFSATVGLVDHRNVLRFRRSTSRDERFAVAAADAAARCLRASERTIADVDAIVAAPAWPGYRAALATLLGVPPERIIVADDDAMHTASLAAALDRATHSLDGGSLAILIAAGAGITAGAALYRIPR